MSDKDAGIKPNEISIFPVRSYWDVNGKQVEIVLTQSMEVYTAKKIIQNFRRKIKPYIGETDRELAARQFNRTINQFLESELFLEQLKAKYIFSIEEFLEL